MIKAAVLFVPLLAGYIFIRTWKFTNYRVVREEFQKLYFRAAFHGIAIAGYSVLTIVNLKFYFPSFCNQLEKMAEVVIPLSGLMIDDADRALPFSNWIDSLLLIAISLMWGCCLGYALNNLAKILYPGLEFAKRHSRLFADFGTEKSAAWRQSTMRIVKLLGDDLEYLLLSALDRTMPVLITLNSRKVYVGMVLEALDPAIDRKHLRIAPILSGFRNDDNLEVNFTTNYWQVYEQILEGTSKSLSHLEIQDFEIVLPVCEICSASLFDIEAYYQFTQQKAKSVDTPPPGAPSVNQRRKKRAKR